MAGFFVIDTKTGTVPNCEEIALNEEWAKHLCYCDIDGFAIMEDGALILTDECGSFAYCPTDRFSVVLDVGAGIYDKEETYPDCTVQVLTNTATGETSVGWWNNGK